MKTSFGVHLVPTRRALGVMGHCIMLVSSMLIALTAAHAAVMRTPASERFGMGVEASDPVPAHLDLTRFLLKRVDDPEQLRGYQVAILAADGVDGFELEIPWRFLVERGATVHVIIPRPAGTPQAAGSGAVIGPKTRIAVINPSGEERDSSFDRFLDQVQAADYDAVYLPGFAAPPLERATPHSMAFLREAVRSGTPIFAIGDSPLLLLDAGLLDRKHATGSPATLSKLSTSNVIVIDAPVVQDGNIHTSRDDFDMPAMMDALLATLLARSAE
jgi:protease I